MVTPAIKTKNLSKHYGDLQAVRSLDLHIHPRQVYGFLGLNGAGKTTTVQMLTGVLPPTHGQAWILGHPVALYNTAIAPKIGVVFGENITPEPGFSPVRYLRHFGRLYGLDKPEIDKRARLLFDVLDLIEYAERPIGHLSGGNKRKVEIARALLHAPKVLFLDEPTRELDIPTKRQVWRFLKRLQDRWKLTIFLSSHDASEIATLCDRIGVLQSGSLTWEGTPHDLTSGKEDMVDALSAKLEGEPRRGHRPRSSP